MTMRSVSFLELACQTPSSSKLSQRSRRLSLGSVVGIGLEEHQHHRLARTFAERNDRRSTSSIRSGRQVPPLLSHHLAIAHLQRNSLYRSPPPVASQKQSVPPNKRTHRTESLWGVTWLDWKGAAVDASWKLQRWRTDGDLLSIQPPAARSRYKIFWCIGSVPCDEQQDQPGTGQV